MGSDVLKEVIAAEAEIQRILDLERKKAREEVEKVRREAEEEVETEENKIKGLYALTLEETGRDAEAKAAEIVGKASAQAEMIKRFDCESAVEAIMRHIILILPEGRRDSQDVQG
jgi:vacuolar-type H+-ATPase subunit H